MSNTRETFSKLNKDCLSCIHGGYTLTVSKKGITVSGVLIEDPQKTVTKDFTDIFDAVVWARNNLLPDDYIDQTAFLEEFKNLE